MTIKMRNMIIGFGLFIPLLVFFAGCGISQQESQARAHLANAEAAYARAKENPEVESHAPVAMMEAGRAVEAASQAKAFDEMDHLAYLAERKTQIAVTTAEEQLAEKEKKALAEEIERLMAQGRVREQQAKMAAMESNKEARASSAEARLQTQRTEIATTEAARLQTEAKVSNAEARASSAEARASSAEARFQTQRAEVAAAEAEKLNLEIVAMKGRQTERGIVLTLGDVLFSTGSANMSTGADNQIKKLATFMKKYPERNVVIEGHTDSTGSEAMNHDLSLRRANAVSNKLAFQEIERGRITTRGLGEGSPIASNDTVVGRSQNRRVEIIVLNPGSSPQAQSGQ